MGFLKPRQVPSLGIEDLPYRNCGGLDVHGTIVDRACADLGHWPRAAFIRLPADSAPEAGLYESPRRTPSRPGTRSDSDFRVQCLPVS